MGKDLKNKDNISLKEETRESLFKTLEDDYGFHIYRDKKINLFDFLDHYKRADYLFLNRIFVSDTEYKDTIDLFSIKKGFSFLIELFVEIYKKKRFMWIFIEKI